jgi:hypothetical protein
MPMNRPRAVTTSVLVAAVASLIAANGCYEPTEPYHTDIDRAHEAWLTSHPREYTFEVAWAWSMLPRSGYTHVEVSDGVVVSATDPDGGLIGGYSLTVDTLWMYVLDARTSGELNSARFDSQGVPIQVDWGDWALDGGVGYRVRNFVKNR